SCGDPRFALGRTQTAHAVAQAAPLLRRQPSEALLIQQRGPDEEAPTPAFLHDRPVEVRPPVDQCRRHPADGTGLASRAEPGGLLEAAGDGRLHQVGGPLDRAPGVVHRLKRAQLDSLASAAKVHELAGWGLEIAARANWLGADRAWGV